MKNFIITLSVLFTSLGVFSQGLVEQQQRQNEIQLNVLYPIAFKSVEVSYERILNEDNAVGISGLYANYENLKEHYMISPYFRKYFSKGYAKGFFLDVFISANGGNYHEYQSNSYYDYETEEWVFEDNSEDHKYNDVAFGIGAGVKFITTDHFVGIIHGGLARNILTKDYPVELIGKGGISIGYRF